MAGIQKFSAQVADYADRLSKMADAAEGKHRTSRKLTRWVALPASGAALYALVRSDFFSRQAKDVVDEAKTRASELPDDLVARVRQTTAASSRNGSQRRSSAARSTKTSSARKSTSAAKSGSRR